MDCPTGKSRYRALSIALATAVLISTTPLTGVAQVAQSDATSQPEAQSSPPSGARMPRVRPLHLVRRPAKLRGRTWKNWYHPSLSIRTCWWHASWLRLLSPPK